MVYLFCDRAPFGTTTVMDDTGDIAKPDTTPRKQSRAARRQQLIEATIDTIAAQGYARTTLTDVARQAGISHGLVNFHFETKERLLNETLQYLAEEYRQNWTAALAAAGPSPAEQLDAMLRADFDPAICTDREPPVSPPCGTRSVSPSMTSMSWIGMPVWDETIIAQPVA